MSDIAKRKKRNGVEYLERPVKSENDKKEYRVIRLPNGFTALLISNEHSKTSATQYPNEEDEEAHCSLCVGAGRFSNSLENPGIAYYFEKLLDYMGSEKYFQDSNSDISFDAFTSKCGGFTYALTDCENTTFYFRIQTKYLLSALDHFAAILIKPLKKDNFNLWRADVESERRIPSSSYRNRMEQLLSSFARTGHPACKFPKDNFITSQDNVDDNKLYEELVKFKRRHYSAHRIKLVVQASLPLDTMENNVSMCFSDVLNNGLPPDDFTQFKNDYFFDTPAFQQMYKVSYSHTFNRLQVTWPMPSLFDFYKSKPHQYISWIIEHKGKGSLTSYLRKKWNCEVTMYNNSFMPASCHYNFMHTSMYTLLNLTVILSYEGLQHLEEILNAIFSFINLLKETGPQKRIYDELRKIRENNFRFSEEDVAEFNVIDLSRSMHFYPSRDYITGNKLHFEYNAKDIQQCLNYLTPEAANIMIFTNKDFELNEVKEWSKTKYTDVEKSIVPQEWVEHWKSIEAPLDIHLPLPNTFLPSDYSLMSVPAAVPKYPKQLISDSTAEIWYHPYSKIRLPKCYMYFHLISSLGLLSPKNAALMDMYCDVLSFLLIEKLYPATAAGINYEISVTEKGITLKIYGFNDKMPFLLKTIEEYMVAYPMLVTRDLFEIVRVRRLEKYYDEFTNSAKLVSEVRLSILKVIHYTHVDMHAALREINFGEFTDFVKSFTQHLYIQCLIQSNITELDVIKNVGQFLKNIKCRPLINNAFQQMRVTRIPLGLNYCKLKIIDKSNSSNSKSVVTNYYQADVTSFELSMLIELMIFIMQDSLFFEPDGEFEHILYDNGNVNGILGYYITVCTRTDKYSTEYIDQSIEKCLTSFKEILEKLSEEDFDNYKESIKKAWHTCDVKHEVDRNWNEITKFEYMFDRFEKKKLALEDLKVDELRKWFDEHTLNGYSFRKLSIHMAGTAPKKEEVNEANYNAKDNEKIQHFALNYVINDEQYWNIEDYKKKLYIYPMNEGSSQSAK
ncbi:nardilysin-like [Mycetomoellerius zeteki]|uniref:nardilysin-like n=1 Tax=Mycetomoellerius zeteki TaxID=64791 RepID=UPI00084E4F44|nr:PREDICTED: nardilysin-like [Trachymyrmex zeteki]